MKYNTRFIESKAYEIIFYWPDDKGTDTIDNLLNWESGDMANRRIYKVSGADEANNIIRTPKKLKLYSA